MMMLLLWWQSSRVIMLSLVLLLRGWCSLLSHHCAHTRQVNALLGGLHLRTIRHLATSIGASDPHTIWHLWIRIRASCISHLVGILLDNRWTAARSRMVRHHRRLRC